MSHACPTKMQFLTWCSLKEIYCTENNLFHPKASWVQVESELGNVVYTVMFSSTFGTNDSKVPSDILKRGVGQGTNIVLLRYFYFSFK